jgi:hypothetical protein
LKVFCRDIQLDSDGAVIDGDPRSLTHGQILIGDGTITVYEEIPPFSQLDECRPDGKILAQ